MFSPSAVAPMNKLNELQASKSFSRSRYSMFQRQNGSLFRIVTVLCFLSLSPCHAFTSTYYKNCHPVAPISIYYPTLKQRRAEISISTTRSGSSSLLSSLASSSPSDEFSSLNKVASLQKDDVDSEKDDDSQNINYHWTKQNLAIAMPAMMGLMADPLLSMVDTAFVGRVLGPIDLAALGVCTSIFHMSFSIFRASTVATTSLVGNAPNKTQARQITKISLYMAGILGSLTLLGLRLGGPALLATMGVSSTSAMYRPACEYLFARCWAAPAVVGIVVAEGAFRGNGDWTTPFIASGAAALINLLLDPILMFPFQMGMMGAATATALSQLGAAGVYGWRIWKRNMLPQPSDKTSGETNVNIASVVKAILGANLSMLAKQGSMLIFYTYATALATRLGPAHVATHQVALSFFWLVTFWLDSGSVSGQVLMSKSQNDIPQAKSLTKYMTKYALLQGLTISALVTAMGRFLPQVFTQDPTIRSLLIQIIPYLAAQQTLVSLCLVLEGLAVGGNQFRYMAGGTAAATVLGMWRLQKATSVVDIWGSAVSIFFVARLLNASIGVARVHWGMRKINRQQEGENGEAAIAAA